MKKIYLILLLLCCLFSANAGTLRRILATDTSTSTPDGCTKVVFVNVSSCSAVPSMVIENSSGERFELVAREPGVAPYMYFIPNGQYVVVSIHNIAALNTAQGGMRVGASFNASSVGYFTIDSKYEETISDSFPSYGPYPMSYEQSAPAGYSKIVVDSSDKFINGNLVIENLTTNKLYTLYGSATYYKQWYYFIPKGKYRVVSVGANYKTRINGSIAYKGFEFKFLESGSVFFNE